MSAPEPASSGDTNIDGDSGSQSDSMAAEVWAEFDVTAWLLQSSCALPVGQFLHSADRRFSLHAAMSALELMDGRMDPGMANPMHTISAQQRQRVADEEQQLQWSERYVLLCADTLLCCLASHMNGLSLPHSLYTFALLHRAPYQHHHTQPAVDGPSDAVPPAVFPLLHQPLLRAIARLLLHTSHACRAIVSRADLYEEEEWNMHDYGLAIDADGGGDALSREASAVEQSLESDLRAEKKAKQHSARRHEKTTNGQAAAVSHSEALLDRVKLCHALLLLFSHLNKPAAPLHTAHKLLARAAAQLHAVMHSTVMAPPHAAQHVHDMHTFRASADCPFDPSIAASLILHAPPRQYSLLSLPAALTLLHQLLTHTSLMLASCSLTSLPALLNFVTYFACQRPNIVLRSCLLSSLLEAADVNRTGRSLLTLLHDALCHLSPSAALFAHPLTRWAVFGPLPSDAAAELRAVPPEDLTTSWMAHMSTLAVQHIRLLLMDPTRQRRKVGAALQLALHLQPAAVSVDQWHALASRRLRIEQADSAWYSMAQQISPSQRRQLEEADKRMVYGSSYYSLVLDAACTIVLHQLIGLFSQQLTVDEELSVLYFAVQHYTHYRANNARAAWRDEKLASLLIEAQQVTAATASPAASKKKRGKQQQQAYKLSVSPPVTADMLLWECVSLLSAALQALIHGMARLRLPSGSQAVAVSLLPPASLRTYFSNRFPWLPEQLAPAVSSALYERQMRDDFDPSLDAEHILALSGRVFGRAREQLTALQHSCKQHPPLPACTSEALIGQPTTLETQYTASAASMPSTPNGSDSPSSSATTVPLPSARVTLLSDLSGRSVLPFDGAFLHSLARVAISNAVTAATAAKSTASTDWASADRSSDSADTPPLSSDRSTVPYRARFSFAVNWLFPVVTVEPTASRGHSVSAVQ